ncbi:unnamed protein product [Ixodes pacificus]
MIKTSRKKKKARVFYSYTQVITVSKCTAFYTTPLVSRFDFFGDGLVVLNLVSTSEVERVCLLPLYTRHTYIYTEHDMSHSAVHRISVHLLLSARNNHTVYYLFYYEERV